MTGLVRATAALLVLIGLTVGMTVTSAAHPDRRAFVVDLDDDSATAAHRKDIAPIARFELGEPARFAVVTVTDDGIRDRKPTHAILATAPKTSPPAAFA